MVVFQVLKHQLQEDDSIPWRDSESHKKTLSRVGGNPAYRESAVVVRGSRSKEDMTQAELAKKLGVTQQYISKLEEGIFSNIREVAKILLVIGYKIEFRIVTIPGRISKIIRNKLQLA